MDPAAAAKELGLLAAVRPPRLEDAGLENCALPADSILEAFSIAAMSLKSRLIPDRDGGGAAGCVEDPAIAMPDTLVDDDKAALPESGGACGGAVEKGRDFLEGAEDAVDAGEEGGVGDRVLVPGPGSDGGEVEAGKGCVVGGEGGVEESGGQEPDGEEEEGKEEAILVEALI